SSVASSPERLKIQLSLLEIKGVGCSLFDATESSKSYRKKGGSVSVKYLFSANSPESPFSMWASSVRL
ncbi:hypothetical protein, partial [Vibrio parahaemolyticus]|uniref:hypothetical protein n=1 Tax=Vibrio parahaemolyticus TaxID=670 RepID=UPI001C5FD09C